MEQLPLIFAVEGRKHDLPPLWDGEPVDWRGWEQPPVMFICGRRQQLPEFCPLCGCVTRRTVNHGVTRAGPAWIHLFAYRCPDCHRDQVYDASTDETWDLDDTDYSNTGSREAVNAADRPRGR